jgi:hypothetical protein
MEKHILNIYVNRVQKSTSSCFIQGEDVKSVQALAFDDGIKKNSFIILLSVQVLVCTPKATVRLVVVVVDVFVIVIMVMAMFILLNLFI